MALSINQKKKIAKYSYDPPLSTFNADELKRIMDFWDISYTSTDTLTQLKAKVIAFSKKTGYSIYVGDIE